MGKREREEEAIGVADAGRGEENHTFFLFSSSSSCCCGSDCNCVCNYVDDSSSIALDDNGFPPPPPPHLSSESGLQDDQVLVDNTNIIFNNYSACDSNGAGLEEDINHSISIETTDSEEGSGFSADFYRCGTNWSSLLPSDNENGNQNNDHSKPMMEMQREPRLKQTNLFQMWGFHNYKSDNNQRTQDVDNVGGASSSSMLQHQNKKIISLTSNNTNNGVIKQRPRVCPFYKKIPGTPFTVDAFRYGHVDGCCGYILSHFHADHYGGLSKGWSHGPIYCTPLTARLLRICLYVNPQFIHPLELDTEYVIEGIKVTLLEANHCPGAALIHFCLPNGQCILHTGDFRASKVMRDYPVLANQRVNVIYLDTTYCNQKYKFPSKEDVLRFVVRVTQNCLRKQPKTLIIVGAYSIGKECVYIAISKALGVKIHADSRRRRILLSFGWHDISANLSSDGKETPLHVLPISSLKFEVLERYLKMYMNQYTAVLAFRPTGWTYSENIGNHLDLIKPSSRGAVTIYGVPYSEHSSFTELREFIQFLRPDKVIPTVNVGNAGQRDKMQSYFREWLKG